MSKLDERLATHESPLQICTVISYSFWHCTWIHQAISPSAWAASPKISYLFVHWVPPTLHAKRIPKNFQSPRTRWKAETSVGSHPWPNLSGMLCSVGWTLYFCVLVTAQDVSICVNTTCQHVFWACQLQRPVAYTGCPISACRGWNMRICRGCFAWQARHFLSPNAARHFLPLAAAVLHGKFLPLRWLAAPWLLRLFRVAGAPLLQRRAETDHDKLHMWHHIPGEPLVNMKEIRIYDDLCMLIPSWPILALHQGFEIWHPVSVSSGRNLRTATPAVYLAPCLTRVFLAPKLMGTRLRVPSAGCFPLFFSATEKFICGSEKNPKNKEVGACRKSLLMALKHLFQQICKIV